MGMSVNKPRAGGRRHRPMGEINVTPFVDVMLVLLIVFMVTAPLLTVGVEVDLPKTKAGQINADAAPLVVSVKADGSLFLQETELIKKTKNKNKDEKKNRVKIKRKIEKEVK
jgi:biopolymer transport protein TolR